MEMRQEAYPTVMETLRLKVKEVQLYPRVTWSSAKCFFFRNCTGKSWKAGIGVLAQW